MTKRIIDADALLEWVRTPRVPVLETVWDTFECKIRELATDDAPQDKTINGKMLLDILKENCLDKKVNNKKVVYFDDVAFHVTNMIHKHYPQLIPQESVDADGWCWDLSLAPKENKIEVIAKDLVSNKKETEIIDSELMDFYVDFIKFIADVHDKQSEFEQLKFGWRPLPKLPNKV